MSAIDLSALPIAGVEFAPIDFGGMLTPPLGGPEQRIDRPGSRTAITFTTPVMKMEPDGRRWAARLARAQRDGAIIEIPQPDLAIGNPGIPTTATNITAGKLIALSGMTPGYTIREGQWLSVIVDGQRYADQAAADVTVGSGGTVTVSVVNLIRVPLTAGLTVEIAAPKIEGWPESLTYPVDTNRHVQFSFTIREAA